jgi:site-specific recombinase XerC
MPRATTKAPSLADGPTLASTRDYWILHLRSEGKSERTVATYLRALDRLDAFLVERGMPRALGAIRREHLEAFFVALGERGNAPATISILFRALRPFWRWLVEEDEVERSPMQRMRAPAVPLNPAPVLSDEESARLLAACRGTDLIARRGHAGRTAGRSWTAATMRPSLAHGVLPRVAHHGLTSHTDKTDPHGLGRQEG